MTTRADIVAAARSLCGTRWQHQGRLRGIGIDCIGLIINVGQDCGVAAPGWSAEPALRGYGRAPDARVLLDACDRWLDTIDVAQATLGDILLLRFTTEPQHFAILSALNPRSIVHAYSAARKVVEHRLDDLWSQRVVGAYRYRGLD